MKKNTPLLQPECLYHIYNRGINGEDLFREEKNYQYFLQKISLYILPVAKVYAYCLLKNHFHLCIRTKKEPEILLFAQEKNNKSLDESRNASWYISHQFAGLFKSYAQSINSVYGRTGGLFEEPFRRIEILEDNYFGWLIYYIHANPQLHGFVPHFSNYPYSSYHSLLSEAPTQLRRNEVLNWFGGREAFKAFHLNQLPDDISSIIALE